MKTSFRVMLSTASLVGMLSACQAISSPTAMKLTMQPPTSAHAVGPSLTPADSTATPMPVPEDEPILATAQSAVLDNGDGLLRFVFPTPAPPPASAWRPPLYDIPWAPTQFDHFYFTRPIAADEVNWPAEDYRYGGIFPNTTDIFHTGIDIEAPLGTPVLAAASGKIIFAGYGLLQGSDAPNDPYGLAVVIEHKFGYQGRRLQTVYAHLKRIDVLSGQSVEMGDPLGLIGQTGMTTGPHLHFEIRLEEGNYYTTRNPELWLAPPQGWGVLTGKVLNGYGYRLQYQKVIVKSSDTGSLWSVRSYGTATIVKSDDHYNENMVLSDLPAGIYQVIIDYFGTRYTQEVTINPGRVSFFTFRGHKGFSLQPVPTPAPETFLNPPTKTP